MAVSIGTAIAYLELDTSKFTTGIKNAGTDLKTFATGAENTSGKLNLIQSAMTKAGGALTKSVTLPLVGIGTASVKVASDFESAMSQVAATMGMTNEEIASGSEDFEKLSSVAKQMGATTAYSATQAAEALNYMALAGYDVEQSVSTLPSVLNLAAAGGMELGRASDVVTDALSALGLTSDNTQEQLKNTEMLVDQMAVTSQKSNTSVAQLGEAILTVGGTAKTLNGGVLEMNTALGVMANEGIKGAEAGTHLRNIILSLSAPTNTASKELKRLGIETKDSSGNLKPLNKLMEELSGQLEGLGSAQKEEVLKKIFNKTDLVAIEALMDGVNGQWEDLSNNIDNSSGAAKQMADVQLNNLNGSLTYLKSALEGAGIAIGEKLIPYIRKLADWITSVITWFNNLSETQQDFIVKIGLIVAAIGPVLTIGAKLISLFKTLAPVITLVKTIGGGLITVLEGLAMAFGWPVTIIATLGTALVALYFKCDAFREIVNKVAKAIADFVYNALISFFEWIEGLQEKFDEAMEIAGEWVANFVSDLSEGASNAVEGFIGFIKELPTKIASWFKRVLNKVTTFGTQLLAKGREAGKKLLDGIVEKVKTIPSKIGEWMQNAVNKVIGFKDSMLSAGKEALGGLLSGIKQKGEEIIGYVTDMVEKVVKKFKEIGSTVSSGATNAMIQEAFPMGVPNGSYSAGLSYVPFDGFIAELHKGERVLTKAEAEEYNTRKGKNSGGDTFNFYNTKPEPYEYARQMKRAKKEMMESYA